MTPPDKGDKANDVDRAEDHETVGYPPVYQQGRREHRHQACRHKQNSPEQAGALLALGSPLGMQHVPGHNQSYDAD